MINFSFHFLPTLTTFEGAQNTYILNQSWKGAHFKRRWEEAFVVVVLVGNNDDFEDDDCMEYGEGFKEKKGKPQFLNPVDSLL